MSPYGEKNTSIVIPRSRLGPGSFNPGVDGVQDIHPLDMGCPADQLHYAGHGLTRKLAGIDNRVNVPQGRKIAWDGLLNFE